MSALYDTTGLVRGTREFFDYFVRCNCMDTPERLAQIVDTCMAEFAAGGNCSVWHCASIVYGQLDRCDCSPCSQGRRTLARAVHS